MSRGRLAVFRITVFAAMLFVVFPPLAGAEQGRRRGDFYTLKLVVIGPGDDVFTWWGHLGVIVENAFTGKEQFYDYGVFSFYAENFYKNLIAGNWDYSMQVRDAAVDIGWYIKTNRDIIYYTLNLDAQQKETLVDFLDWNVRPENRNYFYKLFTDNCVTRVMLLLDQTLEGQFLERYKNEPGRHTVRFHANRHLYPSPVLYWLLNFIMGDTIDTPPSRYDEMYLPAEFAAGAADFFYTSKDGVTVPLVSDIEVISTSKGRNLALDKPPRAYIPGIIVSLILAFIFLYIRHNYIQKNYIQKNSTLQQKNHSRRLWAYVQIVWALLWGILGTVLFLAEFFSNHIYTYRNINVIFANPIILAGIPLSLLAFFAKKEKTALLCGTILRFLWVYMLLAAILTIVVRISPLYYQDNHLTLILLIPSTLVFCCTEKPLGGQNTGLLRN
ncbi:MAG: DUF4105 domain-containing protein [Spirochaetaceae bacterium]|jgi:hypothetical protein|nr:DUF4105 domain-containing protein [Spirochaetaceae bacterium]